MNTCKNNIECEKDEKKIMQYNEERIPAKQQNI